MSLVQERYDPIICGVNSTNVFGSNAVAGFLANTSGTITVSRLGPNSVYTDIVVGLPVTAGIYTPLPFYLTHFGGRIVTAGGASGVLGVG